MSSKQNHNPHNPKNLGASVVPDLMRVYENMTQSSTPQNPPSNTTNNDTKIKASANFTMLHPQQQEQRQLHLRSPPQNPIAAPAGGDIAANNDLIITAANLAQHHTEGASTVGPFQATFHQNLRQMSPYNTTSNGVTPSAAHSGERISSGMVTRNGNKQLSGQVSIQSSTCIVAPPASQPPPLPSSSTATTTRKKSTRSSRKRSLSSKNNQSSEDSSTADSNKGRKKVGDKDGRWSKRFAWPDRLHRDFVAAVFDVGLKHSSPSAILEQMPQNDQITSERIKSHLQKYRLNRQKSKKEFMVNYDASMAKMKAGTMTNDPESMNFGEVAAHLSYKTISDAEMESRNIDLHGMVMSGGGSAGILHLPQLTEEEKLTPVGVSLGYMIGLFFSLKNQLISQRGGDPNSAKIDVDVAGNGLGLNNHQHQEAPPHPSTTSVANAPLSFDIITNRGSPSDPSYYNQQQQHGSNDNDYFYPQQGQNPYQSNDHHIPSTSGQPQQQQQLQPHSYYPEPMQLTYTNDHPAPESSGVNDASATGGGGGDGGSAVTGDQQQPPQSQQQTTSQEITRGTTSMEESRLMKRDMRNQMAFQNKMRKLKEQEFSKYSQGEDDTTTDTKNHTASGGGSTSAANPSYGGAELDPSLTSNSNPKNESSRKVGRVASDDGWFNLGSSNNDPQHIDEEQLFDFLMSDLNTN